MATWTESVPLFGLYVLLAFLPGWVVVRSVGARGLEALAISPAVTVSVLGIAATLTARLGLTWSWLLVVASTVAAAALGWVLLRVLRRRPELPPSRRYLGRPQADLVGASLLGIGIALVTMLPQIGRPDELVDSPDAVYHLNRLRLFLETGDFSLTNPSFYPNGFHVWVGSGLMVGDVPIIAATNVAALVLAAIVWPIGVVALVRHALGPSRLVTYAGGLASAAFVAFPTLLLGWGVLWPNLMGTAVTPAALVLLLQTARTKRATPLLAFAAAVPGLALIHPNVLFALVLFAVTWYVVARTRAGIEGHHPWPRVARDLAIAIGLLVAALVTAPRVSASIASTQAYAWDRIPIGDALLEILGGRLQIYSVLWGLVLLLVIGGAWIVWRVRAAIPVVVMWVACVVLYVMAASSTWAWTDLLTGYWYNDKVRLASLAAVPGVVMVAAAAPAIAWALGKIPALRARPVLAAVLALAAIPLGTVVADFGARSTVLHYFFHPRFPEREILGRDRQENLAELAALVPEGAGVVGRPENGSPLMYALFGTNTFYRSIPILTTGDNGLIGTGFAAMTTRPEVCEALRRNDIRYAIESPNVYWLDRPERTSGLFHLSTVDGLEVVGRSGGYTLYRITACGYGD